MIHWKSPPLKYHVGHSTLIVMKDNELQVRTKNIHIKKLSNFY